MVLEVNGEAVLRADFTTWEAINGDRVYAWIRHTDVPFKEGMEDQLAPIAETLAPAVLNESPCSTLVAVDADQIVDLYDDGSSYHERWRPSTSWRWCFAGWARPSVRHPAEPRHGRASRVPPASGPRPTFPTG